MEREDTGDNDGQGGQEGSRWTGWRGGVTMDRVDKRDHDELGRQEG